MNPLIKTLKAANFIAGKANTAEEIKRHRKLADWAGRLATPKGDVERRRFRLGKIRCEEVRPFFAHNPDYVILYCHGGGYVSGGLDYAGNLSVKLAMATGFTVYSFAYRLAPEHPYPAAQEDVDVVWEYLTENAAEADHVLLAGDSAGGNMALCLTQRLLAEGKPVPRELLLFSPWTDMTGTAESYETNRDIDPILSREFVLNSARAYMGTGTRKTRHSARCSGALRIFRRSTLWREETVFYWMTVSSSRSESIWPVGRRSLTLKRKDGTCISRCRAPWPERP